MSSASGRPTSCTLKGSPSDPNPAGRVTAGWPVRLKAALYSFNVASRFTPWSAPFNLTGQPAVTLPAGFGSDGLPLSVQLVGRPEAEDMLYALAGQIEAARPWADATPPLSGKGAAPVGRT